ncbi:MAG: hypothetical protein L6265_05140 [Thermoplasmatales archaeon]|nr:hypothetical protein [Thermoplasmatales archaeon]
MTPRSIAFATLLDLASGFLYIAVNPVTQPNRSAKPLRIKLCAKNDKKPRKIKIEKKIITRIFLPFVNPANGDL